MTKNKTPQNRQEMLEYIYNEVRPTLAKKLSVREISLSSWGLAAKQIAEKRPNETYKKYKERLLKEITKDANKYLDFSIKVLKKAAKFSKTLEEIDKL